MSKMPAATVDEPGGHGKRLPRGKHGIARELVIDNQRQRLLAAAATVFFERGYGSFSVSSVTTLARVSRQTFYKLFDDKLDCVLATHLLAFQRLERCLRDACAPRRSFAQGVLAALTAAMDFASDSPAQASLLAFAPAAAEPKLTAQALTTNAQMLTLLRERRERCPEATAPGELAEQALLMGVTQVVGAEIAAGRAARLREHVPELARILLTPYVGEGEARRIAGAGRPALAQQRST